MAAWVLLLLLCGLGVQAQVCDVYPRPAGERSHCSAAQEVTRSLVTQPWALPLLHP